MKIQEGVLDRIELTFMVMKNNFLNLLLPLFFYNFLFFGFLYLFFINYVTGILGNINGDNYDGLLSIIYSSEGVLIISILLFMGLLYATLYIPILLATIGIIHKSILNEKINLQTNILFGFNNILNSFNTYWYIFKYVYLLPAVIFIIGGVLFNIVHFIKFDEKIGNILEYTSYSMMITAFILFIVFSIYRGLKASFVLYSAVSEESFTQKNFDLNIKITEGKLLRIFGNFILLGFIIGFATGFIEGIFDIFITSPISIVGLEEIITGLQNSSGNINFNEIMSNSDLDISFSNILYLISTFISQLIGTTGAVFMLVFTYIFMKRLELESKEELNLEIVNQADTKQGDMNKNNNRIEL